MLKKYWIYIVLGLIIGLQTYFIITLKNKTEYPQIVVSAVDSTIITELKALLDNQQDVFISVLRAQERTQRRIAEYKALPVISDPDSIVISINKILSNVQIN